MAVALSGLQIGYYSEKSKDKNTTASSYYTTSNILSELGSAYSSVTGTITPGTESTLTVTKTNGKEYTVKITVSDDGGYTIASVTGSDGSDSSSTSSKWYYDSDGNVTNGTTTLKIGDIVYYDAVTNATTKTYTSETSKSGYTDAQTFSLADDGDTYTWKVMGVDESTGEILIVLSNSTTTGYNYIKTDAGSYYYLTGQTGYVNGVSELNEICSIFGEGYGASKARSMTAEDVNKLTGYDPETAGYNSGSISAYGNKVTYTYVSSSSTAYDDGNGHSGTYSGSFTYYDEDTKEWITLDGSEHTSVTLTSTYYNYTSSNYSCDLVYPSSGYYWLGSTCVDCDSGYAYFELRHVRTSNVYGGILNYSVGDSRNDWRGVRPVVYLSSDISLSGDSTSGWTIE